MSGIFQNADSIKIALFEELQNILSSESNLRTAAEERLKQLKFTEGYGVYLAEITVNDPFDLALRQLASIMLKQYVEEHWSQDAEIEDPSKLLASESAKKAIKNILPLGLHDPNSKIRSVVAYTISTIASWDWPEWVELFDILVKCLGGNENSVHGAMQVLVEFTYDLNYQIAEVGPMILSEVYRIFEAETVYSVKTRSCAVEILNSLIKSFNQHIESKNQQMSLLNPILPSFMEKLIRGLTVPNGHLSNFTLKTEIVKVLTYMVNEMPKFINQYMNQILPPIWQLLTQMADLYIKVIVNETELSPFDDEDSGNTQFIKMILQIFEFIHSIVESKKFKTAICNVLTDLVYIIIIYMQMTEESELNWAEDPEKFVEDEDEEGVDFSIRTSGQDILLIIGQEFQDKMLPSLSEALTKHVAVADADRNSENPKWWKIHEASMLAVGSFKDLILEHEDKFNLTDYLTLVKNLLNYNVSPYLLGRCLWVLSRYAESNIYNLQFLQEVTNITSSSLSADKSPVLKICAVRAIDGFCRNLKEVNDDRKIFLASKLEIFFDGIFPLIGQFQNTVLGLLLETLSSMISFDENFTIQSANKIISLTIVIFLKFHDDRFILEIIQDILKKLSQNSYCLDKLQEKIIPTLVSILNVQSGQTASMQDISLDVLQTIVKYSTAPLSDNLIENAFPAAVHCILRTEDHSVMQSGGECLRFFLSVSPEQVCMYKNGEGLNWIMQVTTMLLNPMNTEFTASFSGRLVITIITKAGNLLGENIDLLLKAVISKMQLVESLSVCMSLVITFAHLILIQMDAVLNFLSTVPGPTGEPAMQFVFSNWLSRQHLFYGTYERKVSTMALCKLFEYGVTTKDSRLTSVTIRDPVEVMANNKARTRSQTAATQKQWADIPILVKIFKLLINELANLKETKDAINESDNGDDDEDEDEDEISENANKNNTGLRNLSALMLFDEDEDEGDDQQLMQELLQDPIFQGDMEQNLTKFFQNFSLDESFRAFAEQLNNTEKSLLQSIQIQFN